MTDHVLLRQVFREADKGAKGWLTRRELKLAMLALFGLKPSKVACIPCREADQGSWR